MFWNVLLVFAVTSGICLVVLDIVNWNDLHTIGDFFAPTENKSDSVFIYIPVVNIIVTSVVVSVVVSMFLEELVENARTWKLFNPIRNFFKIKVK